MFIALFHTTKTALMRKLPILFFLLITACLSCSKEDPNADYHLTCTIDGVNKKFNISAMAFQSTVTGYQGIALGGAETSSSTSATFGFEIANYPSDKPIIAGTYTDGQTDFEILSTYLTEANESFEAGTTLYQDAISSGATITNHLKVAITSIGNGSIKGTFSGDFYLEAESNGAKKVITNGDFYLPLTTTP